MFFYRKLIDFCPTRRISSQKFVSVGYSFFFPIFANVPRRYRARAMEFRWLARSDIPEKYDPATTRTMCVRTDFCYTYSRMGIRYEAHASRESQATEREREREARGKHASINALAGHTGTERAPERPPPVDLSTENILASSATAASRFSSHVNISYTYRHTHTFLCACLCIEVMEVGVYC